MRHAKGNSQRQESQEKKNTYQNKHTQKKIKKIAIRTYI